MSQIPSDPSWLVALDAASKLPKPHVSADPSDGDFASLIDIDTAVTPPPALPSGSRSQTAARRSDTDSPDRSSYSSTSRTDPPPRRDSAAPRSGAKTSDDNDAPSRRTDRAADAAPSDAARAKRDDTDTDGKPAKAEDDDSMSTASALAPGTDLARAAAVTVQPNPLPNAAPGEGATPQTDGTELAGAAIAAAATGGVSGAAAGLSAGPGQTAAGDESAQAAALTAALGKKAQAGAARPGDEDAPAAEADPASAGTTAKPDGTGESAATTGVTKETKDKGLAGSGLAKDAPLSDGQPAAVQNGPATSAGPQADPTGGAVHKTGSAHVAGKTEGKDTDVGSRLDARSDQPRAGAILAAVEPSAAQTTTPVGQNGAVPTVGGVATGLQSGATTAVTQARSDVATPSVPVALLGVEIAAHAQAGKHSFDIRLDPPELGRVHVRLDVDRDGNVTSRLMVDRAETLDLLRRDAPQLERALQDAGLKTDSQTMQFMLRDQQAGQQGTRDDTPASAKQAVAVEGVARSDDAAVTYSRMINRLGGLDIRV